jgi:phospholipid/cholesterol/gamma-HCH transport system ATP-binding protein
VSALEQLGRRRNGNNRAVPEDLLAIETRRLCKRFGGHDVLNGVDLTVPEGALSILLGPSGTGKSVLLKHILGILKADGGDIFVRGRALAGMSLSEVIALRREIGVMFQDGALFSSMSVFDNVAFPLRQHTNLRDPQVRELVEEQLEAVGLLKAASLFPAQLSGGMRKRAGLARALVLEPGIVLCDEPDSGLDPVRTSLLGELLMARHEAVGGTMLIVTHDIALARLVSDHVSVIWQGKVIASGAAERVFASDEPFITQFLSGAAVGPLTMD